MSRSRRKSSGRRQSFPLPHRLNRSFRAGPVLEPNAHADGVTVLDRYPIGVRTHLEGRAHDLAVFVRAEQLQHLAFELCLLLGDIRNHVAKDVERWDSGVPGAGYRLHRREEELLDAEFLVQRRQRDRGYGGRAICVGDDGSAPPAFAALALEQPQVISIHFRDDERDIRLHPEVLRVAQHELSGLRESHLDFARDDGVERGENDWRADEARIARDYSTGHDRVRRRGAVQPAGYFTVFPSR